MTHDKSDLERAREYADRVCEHGIDSIRYGMRNAHGVAMTDFLAGRASRDGEVYEAERRGFDAGLQIGMSFEFDVQRRGREPLPIPTFEEFEKRRGAK